MVCAVNPVYTALADATDDMSRTLRLAGYSVGELEPLYREDTDDEVLLLTARSADPLRRELSWVAEQDAPLRWRIVDNWSGALVATGQTAVGAFRNAAVRFLREVELQRIGRVAESACALVEHGALATPSH